MEAQKAKRVDPLQRKVMAAMEAVSRHFDPDHLLRGIEAEARHILKRHTGPDGRIKLVPNERGGVRLPHEVCHAKDALAQVERARQGDIAAAILAERAAWLLRWEVWRLDARLKLAEVHATTWRGGVIACTHQQQEMLNTIGEADSVDATAFIKSIWGDDWTLGKRRPGKYDKALTDLSRRIQQAGLPTRISFRRDRIVVMTKK